MSEKSYFFYLKNRYVDITKLVLKDLTGSITIKIEITFF